jgi:hypothetical protein
MLIEVFPEVGTAGKVVSTASTVFYMPGSIQNSWQYTDRLPNSKMSGDCAKPPKSLEFVPNRDSGLGKSLSSIVTPITTSPWPRPKHCASGGGAALLCPALRRIACSRRAAAASLLANLPWATTTSMGRASHLSGSAHRTAALQTTTALHAPT